MPQTLDSGSTQLTNAEVLNWIRTTKSRYEADDTADLAAGHRRYARPRAILRSLAKHERELADPKYPYTRNKSVYGDDEAVWSATTELADRLEREIVRPALERKVRNQLSSLSSSSSSSSRGRGGGGAAGAVRAGAAEARELEMEALRKELSQGELLMVINHAPRTRDVFTVLIEGAETRFEPDELAKMVDVIGQVLRRDEGFVNGVVADHQDGMDGVVNGGEEL